VIADVHLGYEWARGAGGDSVPAHSLKETLERLEHLLDRAPIERLIVAGDMVEPLRPCPRTAHDLARLVLWLEERGIDLVLLRGNHDRSLGHASGVHAAAETIVVAEWTIGHGDRPVQGERTITGHHHPCLRLASRSAACFLVGCQRVILPAFSANAAGLDVISSKSPVPWGPAEPRCIACTGEVLLDFGPLASLRQRLRE
jgi:putative SbcD/Mre11-related phosphoesterase